MAIKAGSILIKCDKMTIEEAEHLIAFLDENKFNWEYVNIGGQK